MPKTEPILVPLTLVAEPLTAQLAALRLLCSQIGFALDTAILALSDLPEPDQEGGNDER